MFSPHRTNRCLLYQSQSSFSPSSIFSFTLVECLVVFSIVLVLGAFLLPALSKGRQMARANSCLSLMREYALASCLYADDFADCFPDIRTCLLSDSCFPGYFSLKGTIPVRCPEDATTLRLGRLGQFGNRLVSIGGTSNLSDSAGNVAGGKGAFAQKRTSAVNAFPSRRCQWTDYQNQSEDKSIAGAALSIGKGAGSRATSLREYVYRHPNNNANGAFADGHAAPIHCLVPLVDNGHNLPEYTDWIFPGNTTYPYGPRQLGGPGRTASIADATDSPSVKYR